MTIDHAIQAIQQFQGHSLTKSLSKIEAGVVDLGNQQMQAFCEERQIDASFMVSAAAIKNVAGQINVIIHAAGILCSLPGILEPGEVVQSVSLGAGNTGRKFDLETNFRVAEYKFIDWRGGSETAKVFGVPFELIPFKVEGGAQQPPSPPANQIYAVPAKAHYEINFPVVEGYADPGVTRLMVDWKRVPTLALNPMEVPDVTLMKGLTTVDGALAAYGPGAAAVVNLDQWRKTVRVQQVVQRCQ